MSEFERDMPLLPDDAEDQWIIPEEEWFYVRAEDGTYGPFRTYRDGVSGERRWAFGEPEAGTPADTE